MKKVRVQVPFEVPGSACCNCNRSTELRWVSLEFKSSHAGVFGLGGVESVFAHDFPFCPACRDTAARVPRSPWFWGALLTLAVYLGLAIVFQDDRVYAYGIVGAAVISFGLLQIVDRLRRPAPPQTSRDRPVRLVGARAVADETPTFATFALTNAAFADALAGLNRTPVIHRPVLAGPIVVMMNIVGLAWLGVGFFVGWGAGMLPLVEPQRFWGSSEPSSGYALAAATVGSWFLAWIGWRWLRGRRLPEADTLTFFFRLATLGLPIALAGGLVLGVALAVLTGEV